jgi:glycosyltransferase involved in cell wall biosynthesis
MRSLRVLFVIRPDAGTRAGGDSVQANKTAEELRALGHTVDVAATDAPDPRGYDIVHIFGVFDPPLARRQFDACKSAGVPIALSPIWWDLTDFFARSRAVERTLGKRGNIDRRLERIRESAAQQLASRSERVKAAQRKVLQAGLMREASILLPNSLIEAHSYVRDLGLQHPRVQVVPNAVEASLLDAKVPQTERAGVLCVGRVESRKNQAMLLYALRDVEIEITLAGECYDAYYRTLCERWNPRVRFTGAVSHDEALAMMRGALVHALPAWLETPGIASLEAAASGCAIVSGNRACEYEYFRDSAWYCDPGDPASVRTAVLHALDEAHARKMKSRERLRGFTWHAAALATQLGYEQIL